MTATKARFPQPPPADLAGIPPGPRLPAHLLGAKWLLREHRLLERCRQRYGDVFSLQMWPLGLIIVVCAPSEIKRIFTADPAPCKRVRETPLPSRSPARSRCCCSTASGTCIPAG